MTSRFNAKEVYTIIRYPGYTQDAILKRIRTGMYRVIFFGVIDRIVDAVLVENEPEEICETRSHRLDAYAAIAQDVRLHSRAQHTRAALIEDVMHRYGVTRANARVMIHRARRYHSIQRLESS